MIALDTNILIYAHRTDSEWHRQANTLIVDLAEGDRQWAVPWHCISEFFAHVTNTRLYDDPSSPEVALDTLADWFSSPTVDLLHEQAQHLERLAELVRRSGVRGARIYDARIALICIENGVRELWTADRDFTRFPQLKIHNPLVG